MHAGIDTVIARGKDPEVVFPFEPITSMYDFCRQVVMLNQLGFLSGFVADSKAIASHEEAQELLSRRPHVEWDNRKAFLAAFHVKDDEEEEEEEDLYDF